MATTSVNAGTTSSHVPSIIVSIPQSLLNRVPVAQPLGKLLSQALHGREKAQHSSAVMKPGVGDGAVISKASVIVQIHPSALPRPPTKLLSNKCSHVVSKRICKDKKCFIRSTQFEEDTCARNNENGNVQNFTKHQKMYASSISEPCTMSDFSHPNDNSKQETDVQIHQQENTVSDQCNDGSGQELSTHNSKTKVVPREDHFSCNDVGQLSQTLFCERVSQTNVREVQSSADNVGLTCDNYSVPLDVLELIDRLNIIAKERMIEDAVAKLINCKLGSKPRKCSINDSCDCGAYMKAHREDLDIDCEDRQSEVLASKSTEKETLLQSSYNSSLLKGVNQDPVSTIREKPHFPCHEVEASDITDQLSGERITDSLPSVVSEISEKLKPNEIFEEVISLDPYEIDTDIDLYTEELPVVDKIGNKSFPNQLSEERLSGKSDFTATDAPDEYLPVEKLSGKSGYTAADAPNEYVSVERLSGKSDYTATDAPDECVSVERLCGKSDYTATDAPDKYVPVERLCGKSDYTATDAPDEYVPVERLCGKSDYTTTDAPDEYVPVERLCGKSDYTATDAPDEYVPVERLCGKSDYTATDAPDEYVPVERLCGKSDCTATDAPDEYVPVERLCGKSDYTATDAPDEYVPVERLCGKSDCTATDAPDEYVPVERLSGKSDYSATDAQNVYVPPLVIRKKHSAEDYYTIVKTAPFKTTKSDGELRGNRTKCKITKKLKKADFVLKPVKKYIKTQSCLTKTLNDKQNELRKDVFPADNNNISEVMPSTMKFERNRMTDIQVNMMTTGNAMDKSKLKPMKEQTCLPPFPAEIDSDDLKKSINIVTGSVFPDEDHSACDSNDGVEQIDMKLSESKSHDMCVDFNFFDKSEQSLDDMLDKYSCDTTSTSFKSLSKTAAQGEALGNSETKKNGLPDKTTYEESVRCSDTDQHDQNKDPSDSTQHEGTFNQVGGESCGTLEDQQDSTLTAEKDLELSPQSFALKKIEILHGHCLKRCSVLVCDLHNSWCYLNTDKSYKRKSSEIENTEDADIKHTQQTDIRHEVNKEKDSLMTDTINMDTCSEKSALSTKSVTDHGISAQVKCAQLPEVCKDLLSFSSASEIEEEYHSSKKELCQTESGTMNCLEANKKGIFHHQSMSKEGSVSIEGLQSSSALSANPVEEPRPEKVSKRYSFLPKKLHGKKCKRNVKYQQKSMILGKKKAASALGNNSWNDVMQEMQLLSSSSCLNKAQSGPSIAVLPRIPKKTRPAKDSWTTGPAKRVDVLKKSPLLETPVYPKLCDSKRLLPMLSEQYRNRPHRHSEDSICISERFGHSETGLSDQTGRFEWYPWYASGKRSRNQSGLLHSDPKSDCWRPDQRGERHLSAGQMRNTPITGSRNQSFQNYKSDVFQSSVSARHPICSNQFAQHLTAKGQICSAAIRPKSCQKIDNLKPAGWIYENKFVEKPVGKGTVLSCPSTVKEKSVGSSRYIDIFDTKGKSASHTSQHLHDSNSSNYCSKETCQISDLPRDPRKRVLLLNKGYGGIRRSTNTENKARDQLSTACKADCFTHSAQVERECTEKELRPSVLQTRPVLEEASGHVQGVSQGLLTPKFSDTVRSKTSQLVESAQINNDKQGLLPSTRDQQRQETAQQTLSHSSKTAFGSFAAEVLKEQPQRCGTKFLHGEWYKGFYSKESIVGQTMLTGFDAENKNDLVQSSAKAENKNDLVQSSALQEQLFDISDSAEQNGCGLKISRISQITTAEISQTTGSCSLDGYIDPSYPASDPCCTDFVQTTVAFENAVTQEILQNVLEIPTSLEGAPCSIWDGKDIAAKIELVKESSEKNMLEPVVDDAQDIVITHTPFQVEPELLESVSAQDIADVCIGEVEVEISQSMNTDLATKLVSDNELNGISCDDQCEDEISQHTVAKDTDFNSAETESVENLEYGVSPKLAQVPVKSSGVQNFPFAETVSVALSKEDRTGFSNQTGSLQQMKVDAENTISEMAQNSTENDASQELTVCSSAERNKDTLKERSGLVEQSVEKQNMAEMWDDEAEKNIVKHMTGSVPSNKTLHSINSEITEVLSESNFHGIAEKNKLEHAANDTHDIFITHTPFQVEPELLESVSAQNIADVCIGEVEVEISQSMNTDLATKLVSDNELNGISCDDQCEDEISQHTVAKDTDFNSAETESVENLEYGVSPKLAQVPVKSSGVQNFPFAETVSFALSKEDRTGFSNQTHSLQQMKVDAENTVIAEMAQNPAENHTSEEITLCYLIDREKDTQKKGSGLVQELAEKRNVPKVCDVKVERKVLAENDFYDTVEKNMSTAVKEPKENCYLANIASQDSVPDVPKPETAKEVFVSQCEEKEDKKACALVAKSVLQQDASTSRIDPSARSLSPKDQRSKEKGRMKVLSCSDQEHEAVLNCSLTEFTVIDECGNPDAMTRVSASHVGLGCFDPKGSMKQEHSLTYDDSNDLPVFLTREGKEVTEKNSDQSPILRNVNSLSGNSTFHPETLRTADVYVNTDETQSTNLIQKEETVSSSSQLKIGSQPQLSASQVSFPSEKKPVRGRESRKSTDLKQNTSDSPETSTGSVCPLDIPKKRRLPRLRTWSNSSSEQWKSKSPSCRKRKSQSPTERVRSGSLSSQYRSGSPADKRKTRSRSRSPASRRLLLRSPCGESLSRSPAGRTRRKSRSRSRSSTPRRRFLSGSSNSERWSRSPAGRRKSRLRSRSLLSSRKVLPRSPNGERWSRLPFGRTRKKSRSRSKSPSSSRRVLSRSSSERSHAGRRKSRSRSRSSLSSRRLLSRSPSSERWSRSSVGRTTRKSRSQSRSSLSSRSVLSRSPNSERWSRSTVGRNSRKLRSRSRSKRRVLLRSPRSRHWSLSPADRWRSQSRSRSPMSPISPRFSRRDRRSSSLYWRTGLSYGRREGPSERLNYHPTRGHSREQTVEDRQSRQYHPYGRDFGRDRPRDRSGRWTKEYKPEASFELAYKELSELLADNTSETFHDRRTNGERTAAFAPLFSGSRYSGKRFRGYRFRRSTPPPYFKFKFLAGFEQKMDTKKENSERTSSADVQKNKGRALIAKALDQVLGETEVACQADRVDDDDNAPRQTSDVAESNVEPRGDTREVVLSQDTADDKSPRQNVDTADGITEFKEKSCFTESSAIEQSEEKVYSSLYSPQMLIDESVWSQENTEFSMLKTPASSSQSQAASESVCTASTQGDTVSYFISSWKPLPKGPHTPPEPYPEELSHVPFETSKNNQNETLDCHFEMENEYSNLAADLKCCIGPEKHPEPRNKSSVEQFFCDSDRTGRSNIHFQVRPLKCPKLLTKNRLCSPLASSSESCHSPEATNSGIQNQTDARDPRNRPINPHQTDARGPRTPPDSPHQTDARDPRTHLPHQADARSSRTRPELERQRGPYEIATLFPWKLIPWPGTPAAITFVERIVDYRPNPSLSEEGKQVEVAIYGNDPRQDADRPPFIPGGNSLQAKKRQKQHNLSSIKVVKAIPLEQVAEVGRSSPKDPRLAFRCSAAEKETDTEDGYSHTGTDRDETEDWAPNISLTPEHHIVGKEWLFGKVDCSEDNPEAYASEANELDRKLDQNMLDSVEKDSTVCSDGADKPEEQNVMKGKMNTPSKNIQVEFRSDHKSSDCFKRDSNSFARTDDRRCTLITHSKGDNRSGLDSASIYVQELQDFMSDANHIPASHKSSQKQKQLPSLCCPPYDKACRAFIEDGVIPTDNEMRAVSKQNQLLDVSRKSTKASSPSHGDILNQELLNDIMCLDFAAETTNKMELDLTESCSFPSSSHVLPPFKEFANTLRRPVEMLSTEHVTVGCNPLSKSSIPTKEHDTSHGVSQTDLPGKTFTSVDMASENKNKSMYEVIDILSSSDCSELEEGEIRDSPTKVLYSVSCWKSCEREVPRNTSMEDIWLSEDISLDDSFLSDSSLTGSESDENGEERRPVRRNEKDVCMVAEDREPVAKISEAISSLQVRETLDKFSEEMLVGDLHETENAEIISEATLAIAVDEKENPGMTEAMLAFGVDEKENPKMMHLTYSSPLSCSNQETFDVDQKHEEQSHSWPSEKGGPAQHMHRSQMEQELNAPLSFSAEGLPDNLAVNENASGNTGHRSANFQNVPPCSQHSPFLLKTADLTTIASNDLSAICSVQDSCNQSDEAASELASSHQNNHGLSWQAVYTAHSAVKDIPGNTSTSDSWVETEFVHKASAAVSLNVPLTSAAPELDTSCGQVGSQSRLVLSSSFGCSYMQNACSSRSVSCFSQTTLNSAAQHKLSARLHAQSTKSPSLIPFQRTTNCSNAFFTDPCIQPIPPNSLPQTDVGEQISNTGGPSVLEGTNFAQSAHTLFRGGQFCAGDLTRISSDMYAVPETSRTKGLHATPGPSVFVPNSNLHCATAFPPYRPSIHSTRINSFVQCTNGNPSAAMANLQSDARGSFALLSSRFSTHSIDNIRYPDPQHASCSERLLPSFVRNRYSHSECQPQYDLNHRPAVNVPTSLITPTQTFLPRSSHNSSSVQGDIATPNNPVDLYQF